MEPKKFLNKRVTKYPHKQKLKRKSKHKREGVFKGGWKREKHCSGMGLIRFKRM